jgi:hypothetical protein
MRLCLTAESRIRDARPATGVIKIRHQAVNRRVIHLQRSITMTIAKRLGQNALVLALLTMSAACVVEPRENYYDRDHHRYYSEHNWHECGEGDSHCR